MNEKLSVNHFDNWFVSIVRGNVDPPQRIEPNTPWIREINALAEAWYVVQNELDLIQNEQ